MDAAYLKSSVGPVLANALSFVATQQPEDPIECIANYLLKHSSNTVARNNNQKEQAEIEASKLKEAEEAIVQLKLKQEEERVQAEEAARLAEAQKQVENNTVVTEVEANSAEASDPAINSGEQPTVEEPKGEGEGEGEVPAEESTEATETNTPANEGSDEATAEGAAEPAAEPAAEAEQPCIAPFFGGGE